MPTTYTHQRFAHDCAKTLTGPALAAAEARPGLYITGAHGPDILFYYRAPLPNSVSLYGSRLHHACARSFFKNARQEYEANGDRDAMLAYLLGFLTHFILDSACHGFVNDASAHPGVSHNRLEAVWDARLILRDNRRPTRVFRGEELEPTAENAAVAARFLGLSERQTLAAMRGQKRIMRLLYSPGAAKRRLFRAVTRHMPGELGDLLLDDETPPELEGPLDTLDELYAGALAEFPEMAAALLDYMNGGEELPARFERDFER